MAKPFSVASPGVVKPPQAVRWDKVCPVCLGAFQSNRSDAATCSTHHRQLMSKWNRIMARELTAAGAETSDDVTAWLASKVHGKVDYLEDGTPHVTWKITARFRYWAYRHLTTLADGTQFDDLMDELAGPLILAYPNRRRTK